MDFRKYMKGTQLSPDGDFGIEIETEAISEYRIPSFNYWTTHRDGSLRFFGVEYVLSTPLKLSDVSNALEEFEKKTSKIKFESSVYSSVHVHLNITQMEMIHIANLITLYIMFENVLNRYCGPDRDGNLFCLKTQCAESVINHIVNLFKAMGTGHDDGFTAVRRLREAELKYSAMNLYTLRKFGSLEFRTHKGTTDIGEILNWVKILNSLKVAASKFRSPDQILLEAKHRGYSQFFDSIFTPEQKRLLWTGESEGDIDSNIWYVLLLAKSADWKSWPNLKKKPAPKRMPRLRDDNLEEDFEEEAGPAPPPRPTRFWWIPLASGSYTVTRSDILPSHSAVNVTTLMEEGRWSQQIGDEMMRRYRQREDQRQARNDALAEADRWAWMVGVPGYRTVNRNGGDE